MIALTNFDNGRQVLINKNEITHVEDVGAYRVVSFRITKDLYKNFFVLESIEDIFKIMPR